MHLHAPSNTHRHVRDGASSRECSMKRTVVLFRQLRVLPHVEMRIHLVGPVPLQIQLNRFVVVILEIYLPMIRSIVALFDTVTALLHT